MFFAEYDKDRDGRLRYSEFASAFVPEDKYSASILEKRDANPSGYPFSNRTLTLYKKLWLTFFN